MARSPCDKTTYICTPKSIIFFNEIAETMCAEPSSRWEQRHSMKTNKQHTKIVHNARSSKKNQKKIQQITWTAAAMRFRSRLCISLPFLTSIIIARPIIDAAFSNRKSWQRNYEGNNPYRFKHTNSQVLPNCRMEHFFCWRRWFLLASRTACRAPLLSYGAPHCCCILRFGLQFTLIANIRFDDCLEAPDLPALIKSLLWLLTFSIAIDVQCIWGNHWENHSCWLRFLFQHSQQ